MARPRTPLLSPERIGDAGVELVNAGKPFGVNAIARHLGVTPSSLYHHVSGLDEIVELMRARLVDLYPIHLDGLEWTDALAAVLRVERRMYGDHPFLVPFIMDKVITDPPTLLRYDQVAGVLSAAGFPDAELAIALSVMDAFAIGFGLDLAGPADPWAPLDGTETFGRALAAAPDGRSDEAFEWGVQMLIDGLRARLEERGSR